MLHFCVNNVDLPLVCNKYSTSSKETLLAVSCNKLFLFLFTFLLLILSFLLKCVLFSPIHLVNLGIVMTILENIIRYLFFFRVLELSFQHSSKLLEHTSFWTPHLVVTNNCLPWKQYFVHLKVFLCTKHILLGNASSPQSFSFADRKRTNIDKLAFVLFSFPFLTSVPFDLSPTRRSEIVFSR